MPKSSALADARVWLRCGQESEAAGTPESLRAAEQCFDRAIEILRSDADACRSSALELQLAIAWMNRGNVLLKQETPENLTAAISAYDTAIALLLGLAGPRHELEARNSLGAAWMNRGLALHRLTGPQNIAAALRSHQEAIAALETLPLRQSPWFSRNLTAAHLNFANASLDHRGSAADGVEAIRAARKALTLAATVEPSDLLDADLALKARRVLCDALGQQLAWNERAGLTTDEIAVETSDTVDAALELIRRWEARGQRGFRPLAVRFFRFGARFYTAHQPHFLTEFIRENLDPAVGSAPFADEPAFHAIAAEALIQAISKLRSAPNHFHDDAESHRRRETYHELVAMSARMSALATTEKALTDSPTEQTSSSSSSALSC